jgi:hypothetical protein
MIEIKDGWVIFSGEDSLKFNPKQADDQLKPTLNSDEFQWQDYSQDVRNGYTTFDSYTGVIRRRRLSCCTDAQLAMLGQTVRDELHHFI